MNAVKRWCAIVAVAAVAITGFSGFAVLSSPQTAVAANGSDFNAGYIISDEQFFNGSAMSANEVQSFLNSKVNCANAYCLAVYSQSTPTIGAVSGRCDTYQGSPSESAASIIAKVGAACGISQKALLVLLEKEQGLISMSAPSPGRLAAATGMGCPDTAPCDPSYGGFFYQVYYAARQFKAYAANPSSWNHQAGRVNYIRYSPDASCGSSAVFIQNAATAGLYNYTPYQPNAAALANLYGTGDSCSAYGNRNFWRLYSDWFGSPTTIPNPAGSFDAFSFSAGPSKATLSLNGWTLDLNNTSATLEAHIYVTYPDGSVKGTPVKANQSRPDVGNAYGGAGPNHGFSYSFDVTTGGTFKACVYGIGLTGNRLLDCKSVTIPQGVPTGSYDSLSTSGSGGSTKLTVNGWTFDPDAPTTTTEAHVYVTYPSGAVKGFPLKANQARPDVGAVYPNAGSAHGWSTSIPVDGAGVYQACAYGIAGFWRNMNVLLGCKTINLPNTPPVGAVDDISIDQSGRSMLAHVSGWVFDQGALATSIPVNVYVIDPSGKQTGYPFTANKSRPDVDAVFGSGANHGFDETIDLGTKPGSYQVCVFGIAVSPLAVGNNNLMRCSSFSITSTAPVGSFDAVSISQRGSQATLSVTGWAFDANIPRVASPVDVYVTAPDGSMTGYPLVADKARPDVGAAFPGVGGSHGFTGQMPATQRGTYTVCAFAIGKAVVNIGNNSLLGCKAVVN